MHTPHLALVCTAHRHPYQRRLSTPSIFGSTMHLCVPTWSNLTPSLADYTETLPLGCGAPLVRSVPDMANDSNSRTDLEDPVHVWRPSPSLHMHSVGVGHVASVICGSSWL
jgi:hypothetical protein